MPLKQVVFLGLLALCLPLLGWALQALPPLRRARITWLVFAPAWIVDVNLFFVPYRGTSSGLELGTADLISGAVALSILLERARPPLQLAPPWGWPALAFGVWAACSCSLVAPETSLATWELLRLGRAWVVFVLALHLLREREDLARYLRALRAFVLLEGVLAGAQLLGGEYRVHGSFEHSNPLGITLITLGPPMLAATLEEARGRAGWAAAFLAAALGVVYTRSRASLALFGVASIAVVLVCVARGLLLGRGRILRRSAELVLLGGLAAAPLAITVADGVMARFREAPASSGESRERANLAAQRMLRDHPLLGVGLNHYVRSLDSAYGDEIEEGDRTIVHHVYWLTAAELGWPGLALFLLAAGSFLLAGLRAVGYARDDWIAHVAVGLCVGWTACFLQHLYEWALRKPQNLFQLAVMAAALARLGPLRRAAPAAPPSPGPALAGPTPGGSTTA